MADDFYTRMRAMVKRQLDKRGRDVTLRRVTNTPVPAEPWRATETTQDQVVKALEAKFISRELGGQLVINNENSLIIAAEGLQFEPDTSDVVIDGGTERGIRDVKPVRPGPVAILYTLELAS